MDGSSWARAPLGRLAGASVVAISLALFAGACTTPPTASSNVVNISFAATRAKVINLDNTFLSGSTNAPYVLNLWFRVRLGEANSASAGVVGSRSNAVGAFTAGYSQALVGGQQSKVGFNNVKLLDVADLANPSSHLEIVGTWTWALDRKNIGVATAADEAAAALGRALNATVAAGSVPSDTGQLVSVILGDFGDAVSLIASTLFANIPGLTDAVMGSRMYIGVGTTGTLGQIVDAAIGTAVVPSIAIPILTVPPDIGGGRIFSLGHSYDFPGEIFDQGQGRYALDMGIANSGAANNPPVASYNASTGSGAAPLPVSFDASGSNDTDGTIVAYNWDFGDFTFGSGKNVSHTFMTAGTFPVTLTVTDDDEATTSYTTNVSVGGAPTVAPTGLTKIGSGCCNTWGDFAWNEVPGATAYEIHMGSYFGGGCLTDGDATIPGPTATGRVQQFGLCLGSHYNTTIRAQANGLWGPWSSSVNVTL